MSVSDEKDTLKYKFDKYIHKVKKLEYISDNDKLYLYANYKQALFGNNNNEKPSILDRVAMEKWKAWNNLKDISSESAMKNYISKVKELYKNENKN
jgi:acyl-CoA-binding protein